MEHGCQSQITNLDDTIGTINENIITFQVPMNYWRIMPMQIHQSGQNLPTPVFQHIIPQMLVLLAIFPQCPRCKHLTDKVNLTLPLIIPPFIKRHDVLMLQSLQHPNLSQDLVLLFIVHNTILSSIRNITKINLVPSNFSPLLCIKSLVHNFACTPTQLLIKPSIPLRGVHFHKGRVPWGTQHRKVSFVAMRWRRIIHPIAHQMLIHLVATLLHPLRYRRIHSDPVATHSTYTSSSARSTLTSHSNKTNLLQKFYVYFLV
mmetsp:Transcript_3489/g.7075  ORF Transcript_3489/g.7075 Transcript_3489/m.7075 type:complete len:260 (-) Transcript_3489:253-1032(-)